MILSSALKFTLKMNPNEYSVVMEYLDSEEPPQRIFNSEDSNTCSGICLSSIWDHIILGTRHHEYLKNLWEQYYYQTNS